MQISPVKLQMQAQIMLVVMLGDVVLPLGRYGGAGALERNA